MSPTVVGKFLHCGGERFWVKGVAYGTFAPGGEDGQFPSREQVADDFAMMARHGINTIRTYTAPTLAILDEAARHGLRMTSASAAASIEAHERGILTSASLMVRGQAAVEAATYGREHPRLSVGLHVDLGESVYRDGGWTARYVVVPADESAVVGTEALKQLEVFRELMGSDPTHLDSHQHVHRDEPVRSVLAGVAHEIGVPLRHFTPGVRYCGDFYGQTSTGDPFPDAIGVERLVALLRGLPGDVTELACHPGYDLDLETTYRVERAAEVTTLCDPRVRAALAAEGIELWSFHEVPRGSVAVKHGTSA